MIVIPDLFGAWQKGREAAIQANWNDLANYEKIEAARTANDRSNLQLLAELSDFEINRNIMRNTGDASEMGTNLLRVSHQGDINQAQINNAVTGAKLGVVRGAEQSGVLGRLFGHQLDTAYQTAIGNVANATRDSQGAVDRLAVYDKNRPAYVGHLDNVAKGNIAAGNVVANNAESNALLAQGAYVASTKANTTTANNANAFALGQSGYMRETGQRSAEATLSGLDVGLATNERLLSPDNSAQQQAQRNATYSELIRIGELLQMTPNDPVLKQRYDELAAILGINITPQPLVKDSRGMFTASGTPGADARAYATSPTNTTTNAQGATPQAILPTEQPAEQPSLLYRIGTHPLYPFSYLAEGVGALVTGDYTNGWR